MDELRIYLLGHPAFHKNGRKVRIPRNKAVALAAFLTMSSGKHSRDELAALMWPDEDESTAKGNLRRTLSVLKKSLGDCIDIDRNSAGLTGWIWVDALELGRLAERKNTPSLEEAAELYTGPFLSGLDMTDSLAFDDWSFLTGENLHRDIIGVLEELSRRYAAAGNISKAVEAERRLISLESTNEDAHRRLMDLYARAGNTAAALRQYEVCVRLMQEDSRLISDDTERLYQDIKSGNFLKEEMGRDIHGPESVESRTAKQSIISGKDGIRRALRRGLVAAAGGVVLALAGLAVFLFTGEEALRAAAVEEKPTIAVLPLRYISPRSGEEWIRDGMLDSIISELAQIEGLSVISMTSVMRYRDTEKSAGVIARELGADFLVEGSVTSDDGRICISAQLIDGTSDSHLWAESYERELRNVLQTHRTIAREIAGRIEVELAPLEENRLYRAVTVDPEAYEAYLMGMYIFANEPTPEGLDKSLRHFEKSLEIDPGYAEAWAGLANYYWGVTMYGILPPEVGMAEANAAAERALELDPESAEAHTVMGFIHFYMNWDWKESEEEFRRAIEIKPNSSEARMWYASLLSTLGRYEEAVQEIEKAYKLDPFSLLVRVNLAARYCHARRYEKALAAAEKTRELAPGFYMIYLVEGWTAVGQGRYTDAIAVLKKAYELSGESDYDSLSHLAYAYAYSGDKAACRRILDEMLDEERAGSYVPPSFAAIPYIALGETDSALSFLERAANEHDGNLVWNLPDPIFDEIRYQPRFEAILVELGIENTLD